MNLLRFLSRHKRTTVALVFVFLFSVTLSFAQDTPFTPGQTLDPDCLPGDANCYVASAGGSGVAGVNGDIQYNNAGSLAGNSGLMYDSTSSTLTAGNLNVSGVPITVDAPTNLQSSVDPTNGITGTSDTINFRVYAYRDFGSNGRVYSSSYATLSAPITVDVDDGYNLDTISLNWDAVQGADGYKVLMSDSVIGLSYNYGHDVGNSTQDQIYNLISQFSSAQATVTPTVYYSNTASLGGQVSIGGSLSSSAGNLIPVVGGLDIRDLNSGDDVGLYYNNGNLVFANSVPSTIASSIVVGTDVLTSNINGNNNIAFGKDIFSQNQNINESNNIAIGSNISDPGSVDSGNIFVGNNITSQGNYNLVIGCGSVSGNRNIVIGLDDGRASCPGGNGNEVNIQNIIYAKDTYDQYTFRYDDQRVGINNDNPQNRLDVAAPFTGSTGKSGLRLDGLTSTTTSLGNAPTALSVDANGNVGLYTIASGISSADNGLSVSGNAIELGGSLTQDTDIDPAMHNFTLNGARNLGDSYFSFTPTDVHIGVLDSITGFPSSLEVNPGAVSLTTATGGSWLVQDQVINAFSSLSEDPFVTFTPTSTLVTALANTDPTAFLQADTNGNLSNVSISSIGGVSGTGSVSQIAFWNSASGVSGNDNLWWDNVNSRLGIQAPTPSYLLQVGSSSIDPGIVARFQNQDGTCDVNPTLGAGGFACSSDMNLKKNITVLDDGSSWIYNADITPANNDILSKILALRPITYNWNSEQSTDPKHVGFIAQEVRQVFPDLVTQDPATHLLSLNYTGLVPYTIEAVKEMDMKISVIPDETDPSFTARLSNFLKGIAETGTAMVDHVKTHELCVDDVCVTRDQFLRMVQNNGGQQSVQPSDPAPPSQDSSSTDPGDSSSSAPTDSSTTSIDDSSSTDISNTDSSSTQPVDDSTSTSSDSSTTQ